MNSFVQPDIFGERTLNDWPFGAMRPRSYGLIMADPAWRFVLRSARGEKKSPQKHYAVMSMEDIAALPVGELATDNAVLWLWATAPMLPQQIAIAERWGFTFKTEGTWVKTTPSGKVCFGTGYVLRNAHEPFLICTRGKPKTSRSVRSVIMATRREHSRKPDAAYDAAETLVPGVNRADLFARERRPGWDGWGHEINRFVGGHAA